MTGLPLVLLILQGVVFVAWAILMFRTLFRLRKRGEVRTGASFPGPLTTLKEFAVFATDPDDRTERNRLILLTLALFALILVRVLLIRG